MFTPTEEAKLEALPHIYYEIDQMIWSTDQWIENVIRPLDRHMLNSLLESSLLHQRTLIDFFTGSSAKREKDDVWAEDYGFTTKSLNINADYVERLNKNLAHLTYSRPQHQKSGKTKWVWTDMLPLLELAEEFVKYLLTHYPSLNNTVVAIEEWQQIVQNVEELRSKIAHRAALWGYSYFQFDKPSDTK